MKAKESTKKEEEAIVEFMKLYKRALQECFQPVSIQPRQRDITDLLVSLGFSVVPHGYNEYIGPENAKKKI